jgi:hypothetical protein
MSITSFIVLALLGQAVGGQTGSTPPQTTQKQLAAPLISKMFAKYYAAKTLTGKITLTQGVDSESGKIETSLQFEKPGLLYIKQRLIASETRVWITSSDGKYFCYDMPDRINEGKRKRLVEKQFIHDEVLGDEVLNVEDVYHVSSESLGDRSAPLDIAIARKLDLERVKGQWATLNYVGTTTYNGLTVHVINGDWRESSVKHVSGTYRMLVTDDGDLKQYSLSENVVFDSRLGPKTVVSVWDVDLKVNATPDKSLFVIYR